MQNTVHRLFKLLSHELIKVELESSTRKLLSFLTDREWEKTLRCFNLLEKKKMVYVIKCRNQDLGAKGRKN